MDQQTITAGEITLRAFEVGDIPWVYEVSLDPASRRVAEKAGFRLEATLRQRLVHRGSRVDAWIGSMLGSELPTRPDGPPGRR